MNVFRITDIALVRPLLVIARDNTHASTLLVKALSNGFGQLPDIIYKIDQLAARKPTDPIAAHAQQLLKYGGQGFVHDEEQYDCFNPFE